MDATEQLAAPLFWITSHILFKPRKTEEVCTCRTTLESQIGLLTVTAARSTSEVGKSAPFTLELMHISFPSLYIKACKSWLVESVRVEGEA